MTCITSHSVSFIPRWLNFPLSSLRRQKIISVKGEQNIKGLPSYHLKLHWFGTQGENNVANPEAKWKIYYQLCLYTLRKISSMKRQRPCFCVKTVRHSFIYDWSLSFELTMDLSRSTYNLNSKFWWPPSQRSCDRISGGSTPRLRLQLFAVSHSHVTTFYYGFAKTQHLLMVFWKAAS